MTISEAIKSNPVFVNISSDFLQTVIISRAVDGTADYTAEKIKDVELVSADLYLEIASSPEFKEGQLSIKYDSSVLKSRALNIYEKYQDAKAEELKPKPINILITDRSDA